MNIAMNNYNKYIIKEVKFLINEEKKTANITCLASRKQKYFIPRAIKVKEQDYIIKKISVGAFKSSHITSINFSADSQIETIENGAFYFSSIEEITIPSSMIELKKGWCSLTQFLTKVKVMPNNQHYSLLDESFIIGKSSPECKNFDVLVFAIRQIKKVTIPSFITIIGSYAFEYCSPLKSIEFSSDSKLYLFDENSFSSSSIEKISIPSSITDINDSAFSCCQNLHKIEIPVDSKLKIIGKYAFCNTKIESIFIPSRDMIFGESIFYSCKKLQIIELRDNSVIILKRIS